MNPGDPAPLPPQPDVIPCELSTDTPPPPPAWSDPPPPRPLDTGQDVPAPAPGWQQARAVNDISG